MGPWGCGATLWGRGLIGPWGCTAGLWGWICGAEICGAEICGAAVLIIPPPTPSNTRTPSERCRQGGTWI